MSIATKTGDDGTTGLMYNRRVAKTHERIEAYGSVDELNAAIGHVKSILANPALRDELERLQKDLVVLMGELATEDRDMERYVKDGFVKISAEHRMKLDEGIRAIESRKPSFRGWATPGANTVSAGFDVARTTCRRAERRIWKLNEIGLSVNPEILIYLNRLSDYMWLLARESEPG